MMIVLYSICWTGRKDERVCHAGTSWFALRYDFEDVKTLNGMWHEASPVSISMNTVKSLWICVAGR